MYTEVYIPSQKPHNYKNSSNLERRNIGIANMHKKYWRQDRDPGWLDHILARWSSDICTSTLRTYQHKPCIVAEVLHMFNY